MAELNALNVHLTTSLHFELLDGGNGETEEGEKGGRKKTSSYTTAILVESLISCADKNGGGEDSRERLRMARKRGDSRVGFQLGLKIVHRQCRRCEKGDIGNRDNIPWGYRMF